jgi:hypothetical protein
MGESITIVDSKKTAMKYSILKGLRKNINKAGIKCPIMFKVDKYYCLQILHQ